jgi:hypothetical protein
MTTCVLTRDSEAEFRHRIAAPDRATIETAKRLEGVVLLVDVDETRHTARLVAALRGDGPARICEWARKHGYRAIVSDVSPPPDALMVSAAPRPFA